MIEVAQPTDPLSSAYAAYEQFESRLSTAMDQLVGTNGFAELFTTSATTAMALTRMANGAIDQAMRTTRLAVRHDVTSLARQLARTEDKLERVLQMVEKISDRLDSLETSEAAGTGRARTATSANGSPKDPSGSDGDVAPTEPSRASGARASRSAAKKASGGSS